MTTSRMAMPARLVGVLLASGETRVEGVRAAVSARTRSSAIRLAAPGETRADTGSGAMAVDGAGQLWVTTSSSGIEAVTASSVNEGDVEVETSWNTLQSAGLQRRHQFSSRACNKGDMQWETKAVRRTRPRARSKEPQKTKQRRKSNGISRRKRDKAEPGASLGRWPPQRPRRCGTVWWRATASRLPGPTSGRADMDACAAGVAVVAGPFECQRPQDTQKRLRAAAGVARRLSAGARHRRAA